MHVQPTRGPALIGADADDQMQMAVLSHLLVAYPAPATVEEIVTALSAPDDRSFDGRDHVTRAVRDLGCAGLLHGRDDFVLPTRATARFGELLGL